MSPSTLASLPTETLLQIAASIQGQSRNDSLRALALAARVFRSIAQEALLCFPRLKTSAIHAYLYALWQPGLERLTPKVKTLEILSNSKDRFGTEGQGFLMRYPEQTW